MIHHYTHKVQYYETDKMGIIHHSNYLRFFEEARTDFLDKSGFGYQKMEEYGLIIPVLGIQCDFKASATYGDILEIESEMVTFNGIKFSIVYNITSKNGTVTHVTGETRHCFLNKDFQPILVKRSHPDVYEFMNKVVQTKE